MASDTQKEHLEKARAVRNENQAQLTKIKELEARNKVLEEVGEIFQSEGLSYSNYAKQLITLRNTWPDLFFKLEETFGKVPY